MSYTEDQVRQVFTDYQNFIDDKSLTLHPSIEKFINHKFGQQLEVGKWYKNDCYNSKVCYQENTKSFGTWRGEWGIGWGICFPEWQPMTDQEVHDFLKSECEKRYKVGDVVKSVWSGDLWELETTMIHERTGRGYYVYYDVDVLDLFTGKWAKVVKKESMEERIEKLEKVWETIKNKYNEQLENK
jgi:hypothetical protein